MVKKRSIFSILFEIFMVLLSIPVYWVIYYFVINTSFKTQAEASKLTLKLPEVWYGAENYKYVVTYNHNMLWKTLGNSLLLSFCSIFILVFVASATALVLQRRKNKLSAISNKLILAGLIVPASVIPTYWMLNRLGLANTMPGLILVEVATLFPFATMMFKDFLMTIPREIDEAALIDGCSPLQLYFRIIFPLLKPITVAVIILRSVVVYNDFQNPQYYMSGSRSQTVQIFIYMFKEAFVADYGHLFAAVILVSLPMIILFIVLNKKVMEGMTIGSVKG